MSRAMFRHARFVSGAGWLLVLLLGTLGCGRSNNSQLTGAAVSGMLRYQGKPVTGGVIQLWSQDHQNDAVQSGQGSIEGDGTYKVLNAPLGVCKVVVKTDAVKHDVSALLKRFSGKGAPPPTESVGPPKVYMAINPKYADLKKTDVQITVQKGSQTQDIDLP